ncbi:MAG: tetratricopeptide repeat protein [Desulfobacterales bacterium]|nr:tetratricopeptide repeat protein [Desulfobacterales bacterium]
MAKKRISRARKRILEEPDEFITFSSKLLQFSTKHKGKLACIFGALFIIVIVFSGLQYSSNKSENKAFVQLEQNMTKYEEVKKNMGTEKAYLDVAKDFERILEEYSNNNEGKKIARLIFANLSYDAGDFEKAINLYNIALTDFDTKIFYKNLILNSLGYCHEAKKDYETAIKYFEMIIAEPVAILKDEAFFNLGRLYAVINANDKSIGAFKKIISDYSDSIYIELAEEKVTG